MRMCNRMDELRQRASSIGRLHIPLPGQMGKYSYQHRLSTTSSNLSRSYASSQTMSELSVLTSRPRFSDIEEEDLEDDDTEVKKLIDNYQSNITTANNSSIAKGIKMVSCNDLTSGHLNNKTNKFKCDARLFDRTRVVSKVANGHHHHHHQQHKQHSENGSISWPSELSSISSIPASTNLDHHLLAKRSINDSSLDQGLVAKRDYRYESYKLTPEPTTTASDCGKTAVKTVKQALNSNHNNNNNLTVETSLNDEKPAVAHKWYNVKNDELHRNRLFAKASAKANSNDDLLMVPSDVQQSNHDLDNEECAIKTTTFFGDSLRANKHNSQLTVVNLDQPDSPPANRNKFKNIRNQSKPQQPVKKPSEQQQSIISNSIFLDNEDDKSSSKESSSINQDIISQKFRKNRINSSKSHINNNHDRQKGNQEMDNYNCKATDCLPHNDIIQYNHKKQQQRKGKDIEKPLKLYLPESNANLGVKGFNKSSRVETWSTMIGSSAPPPSATTATAAATNTAAAETNSCDLCQMELTCDECCSFCQAIEQHKRQYCAECFKENDDFVLDDVTMQNFNMATNNNNTRIGPNGDRMQLHRSDNIQPNTTDPSFFSRIRRLSWHSLFGSRKKSLNGSRIWNRLRTGSQRLRGSKRYFRNKSRIFLPDSTTATTPATASAMQTSNGNNEYVNNKMNASYRTYGEHYLKTPLDQRQPVLATSKTATNHHHENDNSRSFIETNNKKSLEDTRMNGKITETNKNNHNSSGNNKEQHQTTFNGDLNKNGANTKPSTTTTTNDKLPILNNKNVLQNNKKLLYNNPMSDYKSTTTYESDLRRRNILLTDNAEYLLNNADSSKQQNQLNDVESFIKPFFISHPGKHSNGDLHLDGKTIELGLNGISISSDSGMEEYDGHSSAEHSPSSGYQHHLSNVNGGYPYNHKQHTHNQKTTNLSNNNYLGHMHHEQQKKLSNHHGSASNHQAMDKSSFSSGHQKEKQVNHINGKAQTTTTTAKDIRRQAGHWSNTNLESQLGYMP